METKKLARHGIIYSVAAILTQLVTLLLVPVFTKNMSQAEFGNYSLLTSAQSLLSIAITLGINSGMTRFINEFEDKNRTKNITLTFSIIWGIIVCLLVLPVSDPIYRALFSSEDNGGYYINLIVVSSALLCLINIYTTYYMMQFKSRHVSVILFTKAVLMLVIAYYLIAQKQSGVEGALLSQLLSHLIVLASIVAYDHKYFRLVFAREELRHMLKYGSGLLLGSVSTWIYTLIDRYFIQVMLGLQQVAVYSLGYRLGMMMEPLFIVPFKSVFTSFKYSVYKEADARKRINEVYKYYIFVGWFCVFGFSVFARPAIIILSTAEYAVAFKVVPYIVLSYLLFGLGEFYSLGIHIKNKSLLDSYILAVGAGSNIAFNIILIPGSGITGAAVATILSYFIMNLLYFFIGRRYYDLEISFLEPFKGAVPFLILYGLYYIAYPVLDSLVYEIILSTLLCLIFVLLSIMFGLIKMQTVKEFINLGLAKVGLGTRQVEESHAN
ncbi:MAG: oligosaccharide flippase family protein [Firmicutes bacterium]|nr:oligosaccharide flippase family protein [Bacillota bacterium]